MKTRGPYMSKASYGFRRSHNVASERMARKKCFAKDLAQMVFRCILDHLHFLDDHILLVLEILLLEARTSQHVGDQIESTLDLVVDHLYNKTGFFVGCERIESSPQTVLLDCDVESGTAGRAFEYRMLDEMRYAVKVGGLVPRAHPRKEPECCRAHAAHRIR